MKSRSRNTTATSDFSPEVEIFPFRACGRNSSFTVDVVTVIFCKTIFSCTQSEQLEFLNSQPYYASKKIVIQSSDFPVRRTGLYRHKKSTAWLCHWGRYHVPPHNAFLVSNYNILAVTPVHKCLEFDE